MGRLACRGGMLWLVLCCFRESCLRHSCGSDCGDGAARAVSAAALTAGLQHRTSLALLGYNQPRAGGQVSVHACALMGEDIPKDGTSSAVGYEQLEEQGRCLYCWFCKVDYAAVSKLELWDGAARAGLSVLQHQPPFLQHRPSSTATAAPQGNYVGVYASGQAHTHLQAQPSQQTH